MPDRSNDLEVATSLGRLEAGLDTLLDRTEKMEKRLEAVVAMTNRWKGASAVLMIIAGFLGWAGNFIIKFIPGHTS